MGTIAAGQGIVFWVLSVAAFGLELWALVEAVRFRASAYVAAGKQTKPLWVAITAVATAIGFLALPVAGILNALGFLAILAVAAAAVFLAGVRPALRSVQGPGGRTSQGPYGGW